MGGELVALRDEDRRALAWLVEEGSDSRITGPRDCIGRYLLGRDASWCRDEDGVESLVDFLGPDGPLMVELKSGVQTADEQAGWLERVAAQTRYTVPEYDSDYGLYYRFDRAQSVYEWCTDPAVEGVDWMSQSAADSVVALRASQSGGEAGAGLAEADAVAEQPAWWDEGWGMFYRLGQSGGYEYSFRSTTDPGTADGIWLSAEQVLQLRARTSDGNVESGVGARRDAVSANWSQSDKAEGASESNTSAPMHGDVEAALVCFEQLGVTSLREVLADADALCAELNRVGGE
jgi:hypothetical protein